MKSLFLFLLVSFGVAAQAQQKPKTTTTAPVKYSVSLGGYSNADVSADVFKAIADSALTVKDSKGNKYPIVRFRINYTFIATFTDSETQQRKDFKDFRASDFYDTNMLSEVWRGSIRDNAKKGDQVLINNIIIRLKDGKKMMVSDFRGTLK
ncbi:MAG TPA: hypothetical protein VLA58_01190 [Chitinophagaceae bacterium]|nr:hypothetical protein [Chitinophagaceae bacterium]